MGLLRSRRASYRSCLGVWGLFVSACVVALVFATPALAQETEATPEATSLGASASQPAPALDAATVDAALKKLEAQANLMWTCIAAFLVFFMQAGFAMVECGFTRTKNAANIVMKNLVDFALGSLGYWAIGFGIMFGVGVSGVFHGWLGWSDFFWTPKKADGSWDNYGLGFLLFQTVFAGTAATIVSGAMAERTKFNAYFVYSIAISVLIYPVFGHWAWGSFSGGFHEGGADASRGWLEAGADGYNAVGLPGFIDFAGSTVVHSIGGWVALAGVLALGPRIGKYSGGRINAIPGHNIPLAALGVFILWVGWFGFNPGSTLSISAGDGDFARIAVTTNLAAAAGMVTGIVASWKWFGKPDPSFAMNGTLAGLVAITAPCSTCDMTGAVIIGGVAGALVVFACVTVEWLGMDDPVGAISVHGVNGVWGTFSVGLFHTSAGLFYGGGFAQLASQIVGIFAAMIWALGSGYIMFALIKSQFGLRVSEQEEIEGLDVHEHGMAAYPNHWVLDSKGSSTGVTRH